MQSVKLAIDPCPKPRMTQSDRWKKRPCTERYWAFKDELRLLWGDRVVPNQLHVIFTIEMPISWGKSKKALFNGKPHHCKPDCDNLLKAFQDSLLDDDSGIWDVRATKYWGLCGSIEVRDLSLESS